MYCLKVLLPYYILYYLIQGPAVCTRSLCEAQCGKAAAENKRAVRSDELSTYVRSHDFWRATCLLEVSMYVSMRDYLLHGKSQY